MEFFKSPITKAFSYPNLDVPGDDEDNEILTPFIPDRKRVSCFSKRFVRLTPLSAEVPTPECHIAINTEGKVVSKFYLTASPYINFITDILPPSNSEITTAVIFSFRGDKPLTNPGSVRHLQTINFDKDRVAVSQKMGWFFTDIHNRALPFWGISKLKSGDPLGVMVVFFSKAEVKECMAETITLPPHESEEVSDYVFENKTSLLHSILITQIINPKTLKTETNPAFQITTHPAPPKTNTSSISFRILRNGPPDTDLTLSAKYTLKADGVPVFGEAIRGEFFEKKEGYLVWDTGVTSATPQIFPPPLIGPASMSALADGIGGIVMVANFDEPKIGEFSLDFKITIVDSIMFNML